MRGYNTLLGSHYDHYHLDYDSYKHDDIPDDVFEVDQGKCVGTSCILFYFIQCGNICGNK